MGRPPKVYDWDGKEAECYRLYVEERKSLNQVARHFTEQYGFCPSKRAFQVQFKKWDFPSKQQPAHKNLPLVDRVRQLWEVNKTQREMIEILAGEGFEIRPRELMRLRTRNGWLMRTPNGTDAPFGGSVIKQRRKVNGDFEYDDIPEITDDTIQEKQNRKTRTNDSQDQDPTTVPMKEKGASWRALSPETERKRQQRMEKLRAQSSDLLYSRKRRRRTRGWSGLPADPPLPPRFPSETTIDECKAFLHLDNETYQAVRDQFEQICRDNGVIKKTLAGPEKWQQVKDRLIAENQKLNREFNGPYNGVAPETKALAINVICMDTTKRMRVVSNRMTIAEAKTVLGVNPEQSRRLRNQFFEILKADRFISKLEAGEDHWEELKQKWIDESDIVQSCLRTPDGTIARTPEKTKALDILCRDVQKRWRDEQARADPSHVKQVNAGPGPGPANFQARRPPKASQPPPLPATTPYAQTVPTSRQAATRATKSGQTKRQGGHKGNDQIDPSLLAAASDSSTALEQLQQYAASAAEGQATMTMPSTAPTNQVQHSFTLPVACVFRLSQASLMGIHPNVWLGTLTNVSLHELLSQAGRQHPNFSVFRVEGIIPGSNGSNDTSLSIDRDDELGAYLDYVSLSGKVAFSVTLQ